MLQDYPHELDRLAGWLELKARESGFTVQRKIIICVVPDPLAREVQVRASFSQHSPGVLHTAQIVGQPAGKCPVCLPQLPKAFLIVNGLSIYTLNQPVINIGRDPASDIYLEDKRISRRHAQLRLIRNRFVIFDLGSRGGTYVNGLPVSSFVLKPGDVISLADIPLVYGQDGEQGGELTQELPAEPGNPEVL